MAYPRDAKPDPATEQGRAGPLVYLQRRCETKLPPAPVAGSCLCCGSRSCPVVGSWLFPTDGAQTAGRDLLPAARSVQPAPLPFAKAREAEKGHGPPGAAGSEGAGAAEAGDGAARLLRGQGQVIFAPYPKIFSYT